MIFIAVLVRGLQLTAALAFFPVACALKLHAKYCANLLSEPSRIDLDTPSL